MRWLLVVSLMIMPWIARGQSAESTVAQVRIDVWTVSPLEASTSSLSYDWVCNPDNGHFYAKTSPDLTWPQAEAEAVLVGGHLATVRSAEEDAWILSEFGQENYWIGFTDEATEGEWLWISGELASYTNWHLGEPNNLNGEDYCIVDPESADWADAGSGPPWGVHYGVIEINDDPVSTSASSFSLLKALY